MVFVPISVSPTMAYIDSINLTVNDALIDV